MKTLDALAQLVGTDKSSLGHGYCAIYEGLFEPLRRQPITLLELGVAHGASIWLWKGYFRSATIIGVDINPVLCDLPPDTHILQCDQAAADLPDKIGQWVPLDIVIDDCSHVFDKTTASFNLLFDCIKPGGLYIIEDIQISEGVMMMEFLDKCKVDYSTYPSANRSGEALAVIVK